MEYIDPNISSPVSSNPPLNIPPEDNSNIPVPLKHNRKKLMLIILMAILFLTFLIPLSVYLISKMTTGQDTPAETSLDSKFPTPETHPSNSVSPNKTKATIPDWEVYTDPQYHYTIEHPKEVTFKDGRFIFKKYASVQEEELGDTPYLKITAEGLGSPRDVASEIENRGRSESEKKNTLENYKEVKFNNISGIKWEKTSFKDDYIQYYLTSDIIAPLVLNIYFFESPYFIKPDDDLKEYDISAFQEEEKIYKEYVEMENIVKKMIPTLTFFKVNDIAQNWIDYDTKSFLKFKYPNHFSVYIIDKGVYEIYNHEYEGGLFMYWIDSSLTRSNSNYDEAYKNLKKYLKNSTEKTINNYKVITGEIATTEAENYFEEIEAKDGTRGRFLSSGDRKSMLTVALIPYKKGAIEVRTTDMDIADYYLDDILKNISISEK